MYRSSSDNFDALLAGGSVIAVIIYFIIMMALCVLVYVSLWKVFVKAGKPGWAALIPIYNFWVLYEISFNNNIMWFIFLFIPGLNIVSFIASLIALCKVFNKGVGFIILTILLSGLTVPVLAFGKAEYCPENKM